MIKEAKFCMDYALSTEHKDKEKFWNLGLEVIGNMVEQLLEIHNELKDLSIE